MRWLSVLLSILGFVQYGYTQQACVIDLAMVVDVSGSIQDTNKPDAPVENWDLVLRFMTDVVDGLDVGKDGTRIALVTFGNRANTEFDFDEYSTKAEVREHTNRTRYWGGNTNTTGGLRQARQQFFEDPNGGQRSNAADVILLVTDGIPTREVDLLPAEVQRLKDMGIRIIAVGVTDQVDTDLLLDIVSNPDTDYFPVENFADLSDILDTIVDETCREVSTLPPPVDDCENVADLYMLLDGSGSINQGNFNIMKQFASDLVGDLSVDNGQVRVGVALFSTTVRNVFGLTQYNSRSDMQAAIATIGYPRGNTNTGEAIRYIRETGFNNGDRNDVPNILVIFTDGSSNNQQLTMEQSDLAKRAGIHIITVGLGGWTNVYELQSVASFPYSKNYIPVQSFSGLNNDLLTRLKSIICDNVDECSSNPCERGTCVNGIDMYHCICPTGYAGINCDRTCRVGNDVVFAIDSSGSVGRENFLRELNFVRSLVYGLNMGDTRVGALQFSNNPQVEFNLNTYVGNMLGVMNGLSMRYLSGTTNTASAISTMRNNMFNSGNGDRVDNNNVGVVITDGRSNDFDQTWSEARQARGVGIDMIAVGIGNNLRMQELQAIASYPNGPNVILAENFEQLSGITDSVLNAICNQDNDCDSDPCENAGECSDTLNGYRCFCRDGYSGINCERECQNEYDIIFVIDASGSIRRERFPLVMEFAVSVVEDFEVSPSRAKFGAVVFSDNAAVAFHLNSYNNKQDVISALRAIRFVGGRTNIAEALEIAKNQMFTSSNGDRNDATNHVILLTDGASTVREGEAVPMAVSMRVDGIKISVLGIGQGANTLELRGMSSSPLSRMMMMAESFTNLENNAQMRTQMVNSVVDSTCDEVNQCSPDPCQNGQCFDDLHQYICDCNFGWVGQECDIRCDQQMDVVLVLDFSGSLDTVFNIVIAFAKEIVYRLPVDRARVGVISYADDATINFDLNDYLQKEEIINALSFSRNGGKTNTQEALTVMYRDLFVNSRGDRSGVPNRGILVTDGGSNMNRAQTLTSAANARDNGIELFVAAIGSNPDMGEVNGIASDPDSSHVVRINDASEVESAAETLAAALCS